jgi:hypothetical protein
MKRRSSSSIGIGCGSFERKAPLASLPDFPKAIRLPTKTGRAQPLYKAAEVIAWTNRHQERN